MASKHKVNAKEEITARSSAPARLRNAMVLLLSAGVSAVIFALLFRKTDLATVTKLWRNVWIPGLLLFLLLSMCMHLLRTLRYRVVLRSSGQNPSFWPLFAVVLVRSLCVDLLPARMGELIYLHLTHRYLRVPVGLAAASFALPFLFDILALGPLVLAGVWSLGAGGELRPELLALGALGLMGLSVLLIWLMPVVLRACLHLLRRIDRPWTRLPRSWGVSMLRGLLAAARHRIFGRLLWLSLLIRLSKYTAMYVLLHAMLAVKGYTWADLPPAPVFLGLVASEMAASLPFSGIFGFGAYEGVWALVFHMLLLPADLAAASGIAHHAFTQAYAWVLGLTAMSALHCSRRKSA